MNSQKPAGKSENIKRTNSRDRKRSIAIIAVMFGSVIGVVILFLAIIGAMSHYNETPDSSNGSLIFHEADYEYDILADKGYLDLDRNIYFYNPDNGIQVAISEDNLEDVPTDQHKFVLLLCDFINYAINGQTEEFNSLFSDEYIDADGKIKMDFTMQQLYNIKISYVQVTSEEVNGSTYVSYDYWLEYMIRRNNGTFRNDMESDCIRKEYVRVTDRNGDVGIDILAPYRTETVKSEVMSRDTIIAIAASSAIIITVVIVIAVLVLSKKRTGNK